MPRRTDSRRALNRGPLVPHGWSILPRGIRITCLAICRNAPTRSLGTPLWYVACMRQSWTQRRSSASSPLPSLGAAPHKRAASPRARKRPAGESQRGEEMGRRNDQRKGRGRRDCVDRWVRLPDFVARSSTSSPRDYRRNLKRVFENGKMIVNERDGLPSGESRGSRPWSSSGYDPRAATPAHRWPTA